MQSVSFSLVCSTPSEPSAFAIIWHALTLLIPLLQPDWLDAPPPPNPDGTPGDPPEDDEMPSEDTLNYWAHRLIVSLHLSAPLRLAARSCQDHVADLTSACVACLNSLCMTPLPLSSLKIDLTRARRMAWGRGRRCSSPRTGSELRAVRSLSGRSILLSLSLSDAH